MSEANVKWTVRVLAAQFQGSIERLAIMADIEPEHLKSVSSGRAAMTGTDLIKLSIATGISPFNIATE